MRCVGSAAELERKRQQAARAALGGASYRQVAAILGVHPRSVGKWTAQAKAGGIQALKAKPHPGAKPKLTARQVRQVRAWVARRPTALGFATDLWTARRLGQLIRRRFHVQFHEHYLCAWLARHGITPQKPGVRPRERNEAQVQRWIRTEWPRIKKKGQASEGSPPLVG